MNKAEERFFGRQITWIARDGRSLHVDEMDSDHVANCAVMIYNHLCLSCGDNEMTVELGDRVENSWIVQSMMSPNEAVKAMLVFIAELQERGDGFLSDYANRRYSLMMEKLMKTKMLEAINE